MKRNPAKIVSMKILNFGSLNIDHVYTVDHIVRPGETIGSRAYSQFCGGKGLNQSIALARAGAEVFHAGKIGHEGRFLVDRLNRDGVDTGHVDVVDGASGHAIIQVDDSGENSIVLFGGANRAIRPLDAEKTIAAFSAGDILLLQNEISAVPDILSAAAKREMRIAFNPAPFSAEVLDYPLADVSWFIVNETEGKGMTGESEPGAIAAAMLERFPDSAVILTLGAKGALYIDADRKIAVGAEAVTAVDTTGAGDTFIGYFLTLCSQGREVRECLELACRAAGICVTRSGAADSIPMRDEVIG